MTGWSSVDRLVALEHPDELRDLLRARLGLQGRLDPEEDGVPIPTVESGEEASCLWVAAQGRLEIGRHGCLAGRLVGGIPSSIPLGAIHGLQPGGVHSTGLDECEGLVLVDLRPDALLGARREPLDPEVLAVGLLLGIDPPEAQRHLDRIVIRDRRNGTALLGELQPHSGSRFVVF